MHCLLRNLSPLWWNYCFGNLTAYTYLKCHIMAGKRCYLILWAGAAVCQGELPLCAGREKKQLFVRQTCRSHRTRDTDMMTICLQPTENPPHKSDWGESWHWEMPWDINTRPHTAAASSMCRPQAPGVVRPSNDPYFNMYGFLPLGPNV